MNGIRLWNCLTYPVYRQFEPQIQLWNKVQLLKNTWILRLFFFIQLDFTLEPYATSTINITFEWFFDKKTTNDVLWNKTLSGWLKVVNKIVCRVFFWFLNTFHLLPIVLLFTSCINETLWIVFRIKKMEKSSSTMSRFQKFHISDWIDRGITSNAMIQTNTKHSLLTKLISMRWISRDDKTFITFNNCFCFSLSIYTSDSNSPPARTIAYTIARPLSFDWIEFNW